MPAYNINCATQYFWTALFYEVIDPFIIMQLPYFL